MNVAIICKICDFEMLYAGIHRFMLYSICITHICGKAASLPGCGFAMSNDAVIFS